MMAARSLRIDTLRGIAVFGIMLINVWSVVYGMTFPRYGVFDSGASALDQATVFFAAAFAEQKFYPIFAFLFGAGFALQTGARRAPGPALDDIRRVYRRRLRWLLVCGLLHGTLIWFGDILTAYALTGFWLAYKAGQPLARLARSLRILVVVNLVLALVLGVGNYLMASMPVGDQVELRTELENQARMYTQGGWAEIALARLKDFAYLILDLPVFMPVLALLFLLGVFAVRLGWLTRPERHREEWRRVLAIGMGIGLPLNLWWGYVALRASIDPYEPAPWTPLASGLSGLTGPWLAAGFVALLMLAGPRVLTILGRWFAPVGRMALTNYLTQSVLLTVLLQGFGFKLGAQLGHAQLIALCGAIMLLQIGASRWWLAYHAQGPFEALWRRYTYGRKP